MEYAFRHRVNSLGEKNPKKSPTLQVNKTGFYVVVLFCIYGSDSRTNMRQAQKSNISKTAVILKNSMERINFLDFYQGNKKVCPEFDDRICRN